MTPLPRLHALLVLMLLALPATSGGCATRGPATMRIAVVGHDRGGQGWQMVDELEERLVGALTRAPRVEPFGAKTLSGERGTLASSLSYAADDAAAREIAARRELTHLLLFDVEDGERGPRAELRGLTVATGEVVWRATWSRDQGGLGAAVEPWVRHLLATTGYDQGLPPVTDGPARRAVADLVWSANAALGDGDEVAAEERFREALRRDPTEIRAHLGLARLLRGQAQLEAALAACEAALALRPDLTSSRVAVAALAVDVGASLSDAAARLDDKLDRLADGDGADEKLRRSFRERRDVARERAAASLERAYTLAEHTEPLTAARAALRLANVPGDHARSVAALERALRRLALSPCALGVRGEVVACDQGDLLSGLRTNHDLITALARLQIPDASGRHGGSHGSSGAGGLEAPTAADGVPRDCAGATPLHDAAAAGDGTAVAALLAGGAPVDLRDLHAWTPLHRAARAGDVATLGQLLGAGADPAARDARGRTPLQVAVLFERLDAVRHLAPRTPLEARTRSGETALHLAARVGSAPIARALLAAGARVDAPAWAGRTPLVIAATYGHTDVVKVLTGAGADPAVVETTGLSALHVVASEGSPAGIRALVVAGADVAAENGLGLTPLDFAVSKGRADNVAALLALGAAPNRLGPAGRAALHEAAAKGAIDIVRALIAGGADLNLRDRDGRTPLASAALAGHAPVVAALLAEDADATLVDGRGRTPLELAVLASRAEVVEVFLGEAPLGNAPPSERAHRCALLLLGARKGTSVEVAKALINGGCGIDTKDDRGRDAAMLAAAAGHERLALYLAERGADLDARDAGGATLLHHAARGDAAAVAGWLLARRKPLRDVRDARGWLPLHYAAAGGSGDVIALLVAAGADPKARTGDGADAAHVAAAFGHTWLVTELIRDGHATLDIDLAAALGDVDRVRALAKADPERANAPGATGLTPLMLAITNGQTEVAAALVDLKVDLEVVAASNAADPAVVGLPAVAFADRSNRRDLVHIMVANGAAPPPNAELEVFDADADGVPDFEDAPRFKQLYDLSEAGKGGGGDGTVGEPVVPVGAEPLGVQIRERASLLDVLVLRYVLDAEHRERADDGWDAVAVDCMERGEHAVASRELSDQLVLRRTADKATPAEVGIVRHNLGRAQTYLARYDEAERTLEAAAAELSAEPLLLAAVQAAQAELSALIGRFGDAERLYRAALAVWDAPESYAPAAWARQVRSALANLYTDMARYAEAKAAFAELVARRTGADPDGLAIALNNQAVLFDLLGDHAAANEGYERALELLTPRARAPMRAVILNNLGFARLRAGDPRAAIELVERAAKALGEPPWDARPHYARGRALVTWARAALALGDLATARRLLGRAEEELRAVHGDLHGVVADVVRRLGELDLLEGRTDEALERLYEALATARLSGSLEHSWRIEDDLARALVAAGRPRAAVALGKLAVNTLQALRARTDGVGATLARAYLAERTAPYRRLAGLLVDGGRVMEAQLVLDMLKDEEAYAFTRASRASAGVPVLGAEELAASAVETRGSADLKSRESLKNYLRGFKRAVAAALLAVDADDEQAAATIEARLDQLSLDRLDDLRAFLEDQAVVTERVAFLQIFLSDDAVRILLTRPERETQPFESKVPVRRVYQLISRLREQLQDERSDPRATARELYDALLRPVRAELDAAGVQTLMVWLDGALRYAPLAALHDGEGWLVERFKLAMYTPVTHAALKDRRTGAWRINAFGMSKQAPGFDPLPGVPDELEAIVARDGEPAGAGAMKGALWLDGAFTAEALRKALQDTGVQAVHVASHYAFDPEGDEGSFLLLGDATHMSLGTIRGIARRGRLGLMTFSACNTAVGLGALAGAESSNDPLGLEVEGLGNVVQRELATAVLATLWPVVDTSTVAFMRELYGALESDPSLSKAAAVQRAQLRLLRGEVDDGRAKSWSHPRFWAPFVLMGNWR